MNALETFEGAPSSHGYGVVLRLRWLEKVIFLINPDTDPRRRLSLESSDTGVCALRASPAQVVVGGLTEFTGEDMLREHFDAYGSNPRP